MRTFNHVVIFNNCPFAHNIKIIWNNAPDTECYRLGSGRTWDKAAYSWPFASYDTTVLC
ncbi:hypothetical protein Aple_014660 [Acrocarpospora pleiomorpha]|uniref:Uncharacterized protein n=1 Tax=Acrocarpospora pleiomorpha TaxID=90975 RepID=A0A5M3XG43_9ACTN|nr:hypothetical protein Aple_014660 [Acrocarpospora pleiomorpha]